MELKDILPIIVGAVGIIVGAVIAIWQSAKSNKMEKRMLSFEKQNLELQRQMFQYQLKKDKETVQASQTEELTVQKQIKTDAGSYCEHIINKYQELDFTGLNAILQKPLLLEDIYVRLRAKQSLNQEHLHSINDFNALQEDKAKKADQDFVTLFTTLHNQSIKKGKPLKALILGHPGSGKTTVMKWIALQCTCTKTQSIFSGYTPVFIPLKDMGRDAVNNFKEKNILALTQARLELENCSPSFIKERFDENRLLFLLDGLDEVAEEEKRKQVIEWIQNQNMGKNGLLITSRFSGLQPKKGLSFRDGFPVYAILDFTMEDIELFLANWYKNIEIAVAGSEGKQQITQAEQKGKTQYDDLIATLQDDKYEKLRELAVNPLLLTIIAIVHRTRAVLPRERHKLYEECLRVMIELWHVANKKLNVSFSEVNCLNNLAKLAVALMKENRRELLLHEIEALMPATIQEQSLHYFLEAMVLKSGLLYCSEGKYGFLHLTFQEYLAAWYYAKSANQNDILEYRDEDYWTETFKLFVNIGNSRTFYDEIITNLEAKGYWEQMELWENCLRDIVAEDVQQEMELKFARQVVAILQGIPYQEENEPLINHLYVHYPLYKWASRFINEGWLLFRQAKHPFIQSVGSSILNRAGVTQQSALMTELKQQLEAVEASFPPASPGQLLNFFYQHNNSFLLLLVGRKNLTDFIFALGKLKSVRFFLVYLDLLDLLYLQDLKDFRDLIDIRSLLDLQSLLSFQIFRELKDPQDLVDLVDLRSLRSHRNHLYFRDLRSLRSLRDQFINKYEAIIKRNKPWIDTWVDKTFKKMKALPDQDLLRYFPNTTQEELQAFREQRF